MADNDNQDDPHALDHLDAAHKSLLAALEEFEKRATVAISGYLSPSQEDKLSNYLAKLYKVRLKLFRMRSFN